MTEYPKPDANTDKEIWRAPSCLGAYYPPETIFVTEDGKIGIQVEGRATIMSAKEWFAAGNRGHPLNKIWFTPDEAEKLLRKEEIDFRTKSAAMVERAAAPKPKVNFGYDKFVLQKIEERADHPSFDMSYGIRTIAGMLEKVLIHLEGKNDD